MAKYTQTIRRQIADELFECVWHLKDQTDNEEPHKLTWEWFKDMSQRKLPNFGLRKGLGNVEFKTSNDWFDSFRKRNNIAFYIKSGEKADVDVAVVEDCKEKPI